MVHKSSARVPMPKRRQKRRKRQRTAISDQTNIRNRDLEKRSANGDSKENFCEEVEPNKYAASIVKQKELEEILKNVTQGNLRQYSIFITNLCAIAKFCLERTPSLLPEVEAYMGKHEESGHALLTFILEGPHSSLIPQKDPPSPWKKTSSKGPATEPNPAKQQPEASSSGTPVGQQQSVIMACLKGAEGQSSCPDRPPQAIQTDPTGLTGAVQRPAPAYSAPIHQQTYQQPLQEHTLNGQMSPTQGAAGLNFTSYRQQPPLELTTASEPALVPALGEQNPLPTGQFPSTVQPGKVSQYASNAVHQGSSNTAQLFPASSTVQQAPHDSHPVVNHGAQPVMAQPFEMHDAEQSHATPLNFAPKQPQTPATHPASIQVDDDPLASLGWAIDGQSQVPPLTMQSKQGPAVLNSSAQQPTTFPSGPQRTTNPPSSTQISNQATAPVQQGNIAYPTQALFQAHGQPETLHMLARSFVTQPQTGTAPNPLWSGPSQEGYCDGSAQHHYQQTPSTWQTMP
ncbi:uncharacterized protein ASPGLDRAFT_35225 [Aspergillus glaucus CBS 516.65]|uniref:Uncharacterized protein n=1 Tax=Aspergillus glaucus CBS 516.65 TaxID=1160497 RepID=A0A1L9VLI4_ASPGL|nr:hypothetical protein ASPGLDRAFT_35225 [Aspergillus glaucus CBS 516.65]OJJ84754.1 hypothetical protein ASPGLDRAFT_35225 [Aspergillus glaucus CBS 516.65]